MQRVHRSDHSPGHPQGLPHTHQRVHFVGIAGVGMSGLAQVVLARGVRVSGSDPHTNAATERLRTQGASVCTAQSAENIAREKPDLVVATAAVHGDNPEVRAAHDAGIPVVTRAEFLGRLMAEFGGPRVAVAGTHGKTTTTAMVAEVLLAGGLDPTILVGGEYPPIGGTARVGQGAAFLTEACEAYDSFLSLYPDITVITNVEADHLDHYGTEEGVFEGFRRFAEQTAPGGCMVYCGDDPGAVKLMSMLDAARREMVAYGLTPHGDRCVWAADIETAGRGTSFIVWQRADGKDTQLGAVCLGAHGEHNVRNALAAAAVGLRAGVAFDALRQGLEAFAGTGRRFETIAEVGGVRVVDDYAHHPTEIRATLAAARGAFSDRRLIAVFQPHLYSRTRDFMDGFAEALSAADAVLLTDIYAAREQPIPGVSVTDMVRLIAERAPQKTVMYLPSKSDVVGGLEWIARPGDVVLTMGAGDIREAGEAFAGKLADRAGHPAVAV